MAVQPCLACVIHSWLDRASWILTRAPSISESKVLPFFSLPFLLFFRHPQPPLCCFWDHIVPLTSKGASKVVPFLTSLPHCRGPQSLGATLAPCPHPNRPSLT